MLAICPSSLSVEEVKFFFEENNWVVKEGLVDCEELWVAARKLGMTSKLCKLNSTIYRPLWRPSPIVSSVLGLVEECLSTNANPRELGINDCRCWKPWDSAPFNSTEAFLSSKTRTGVPSESKGSDCGENRNLAKQRATPGEENSGKSTGEDNSHESRCRLGLSALDIGCGSGRDVVWMALHGWNVKGLDKWSAALDRARALARRLNVDSLVSLESRDLEKNCTLPEPDVSSQRIIDLESLNSEKMLIKEQLSASLSHQDSISGDCAQETKDIQSQHQNMHSTGDKDETICEDGLENEDNQEDVGMYDLINVSRYLHRPLFHNIRSAIRMGGFIFYHTFLDGAQAFGHPTKPEHLLQEKELYDQFGPRFGFDVLCNMKHSLSDGRPTSFFVARKIVCVDEPDFNPFTPPFVPPSIVPSTPSIHNKRDHLHSLSPVQQTYSVMSPSITQTTSIQPQYFPQVYVVSPSSQNSFNSVAHSMSIPTLNNSYSNLVPTLIQPQHVQSHAYPQFHPQLHSMANPQYPFPYQLLIPESPYPVPHMPFSHSQAHTPQVQQTNANETKHYQKQKNGHYTNHKNKNHSADVHSSPKNRGNQRYRSSKQSPNPDRNHRHGDRPHKYAVPHTNTHEQITRTDSLINSHHKQNQPSQTAFPATLVSPVSTREYSPAFDSSAADSTSVSPLYHGTLMSIEAQLATLLSTESQDKNTRDEIERIRAKIAALTGLNPQTNCESKLE